MIHLSEISANPKSSSILIMSENPAFIQCFEDFGPSWDDVVIATEHNSFRSMDGLIAELLFKYDVVLFDANPHDTLECVTLEKLLKNRTSKTIFVALTDSDLSIAKARHLKDLGVDEVLPLDLTQQALKSEIDRALKARKAPPPLRLEPAPRQDLAQVIAVTQARGGAGATTVAVNLACSLARKGTLLKKSSRKRVALLDFDLQFGNANVFLDIEDNGGFLRMIESGEIPDARYLSGLMQKHDLGIDVLCAPATVAPLQSMSVEMVATIIDLLRPEYDYIVVDLPRALLDWIEPVVKKASQMLIVTDTSVPCVRQARRLLDFYKSESEHLRIDIIVNRQKKPMLRSEHIREAEKVLDRKMAHWLPDNPKIARKSVDLGRPVVASNASSDLGKALSKLSATYLSAPETANASSTTGMI